MPLNRAGGPLPLASLNHISLICKSVKDSLDFYENVLGFVPVKRPGSFDFAGAWLFNYGVGIHLLQSKNPGDLPKKSEINPRDNHLSFQCESMQLVERKLQELKIKYLKCIVEEGGVYVDQLFIHDPDGFMIEICNCNNLQVVPLGSTSHACSLQSAINSNIHVNIIPTNHHPQHILKPSLVPQKLPKFGTASAGQEAEFSMI